MIGKMSNYNKTLSQNFESKKNSETPSFNDKNESRELFKSAISEALNKKFDTLSAAQSDSEMPSPSQRHKMRMNRFFREQVGGSFLPFPEADNLYEKIRSKIVIEFKTNKLVVRLKKRK